MDMSIILKNLFIVGEIEYDCTVSVLSIDVIYLTQTEVALDALHLCNPEYVNKYGLILFSCFKSSNRNPYKTDK